MSKNKMDYSDTTIIIPTLNEESNIEELLERLQANYKNIRIIVSDDGSRDNTQNIVTTFHKKNQNIYLLDRSIERIHGLTASVIDAVKVVKTKYCVIMDGDMQHPPEKVQEIIYKLRNNNDIVIGVRKKINFGNAFRKIMSRIAIALGQMRLLSKGIWCHDVVSGFFGVDTELFQNKIRKYENKFEKEGFKVLFDLLKLMNYNANVGMVLYNFGYRTLGKSKIKNKHVLIYIRSVFK